MRIESTETGVNFIPETSFERAELVRIHRSGVERVRFPAFDTWDNKRDDIGPMQVVMRSNAWDR